MFWSSKEFYVDNTEAMQQKQNWNCARQVILLTIFLHNLTYIVDARIRVSDKEQPVMSAIYG
jgi:hypothetical protein